MPLKITKANEPITVDQLVVVIYGAPGVGKTSLGYSASRSLLLDFDEGAHRAVGRTDTVIVKDWRDLNGLTEDDLEPYDTIVVDTAGRALDRLAADIIRRDPKKGYNGALSQQGYGVLGAEFIAWMKQLREFHKDVVLIAHASEESSGDDRLERIDMLGKKSVNEVYKCADLMGRLSIRAGKRMLDFSPTDTAFGKNPAQLPPLVVGNNDPGFLANVIQQSKDALNALSEEQMAFVEAINKWTEKVDAANTPELLTALVDEQREANEALKPRIQALIRQSGDRNNWEWSKEADGYVAKEAA